MAETKSTEPMDLSGSGGGEGVGEGSDVKYAEVEKVSEVDVDAETFDAWLASMVDPTTRLDKAGIALSNARIQRLCELVRTQEIRDIEEFTDVLYARVFELLCKCWEDKDWSFGRLVYVLVLGLMDLPEWDHARAAKHLPPTTLRTMIAQFSSAEKEEVSCVRSLVHKVYQNCPSLRRRIRKLLGTWLMRLVRMPRSCDGSKACLEVLQAIVTGMNAPASDAALELLMDVLIPLHYTNLMAGELTTVMQTYHTPLVNCVSSIVKLRPEVVVPVVNLLLEHWPEDRDGVSPKVVALLHEVQELMKHTDGRTFSMIAKPLMKRLMTSMSSDYARVAERALMFWKDKTFRKVIQPHIKEYISQLLYVLVRGFEPHWNSSVNKMSGMVLRYIKEDAPDVFVECVERYWGDPTKHVPRAPAAAASTPLSGAIGGGGGGSGSKMQRPPDRTSAVVSDAKKPRVYLGVTGVAPWANPTDAGGRPVPSAHSQHDASTHPDGGVFKLKKVAPPPTSEATGVHADATAATPSSETPKPVDVTPTPAIKVAVKPGRGMARVMALIEKIAPKNTYDPSKETEKAVMALTPTLRPDLRFHDLVYGKVLGTGAFSEVKYAKLICKGISNAKWPEYAVKKIKTELIAKLGYEGNVAREIAVLRLIQHPSVARLVASFRWRDGAYLVLEYGERGDLHTHITKLGSLSEESTRFAAGEIVAALSSIHEAGFVFGDLKPENVLLTTSGHIKLTDFGAVRAATDEARTILDKSKDAVRKLRDGDWRDKPPAKATSEKKEDDSKSKLDEIPEPVMNDDRIEGTTAYMPPEVVRGGRPTPAADCWALGCLIYFALAGRPPVWAETDAELMDKVVAFDCERSFPDDFPDLAKDLVTKLLNPNPAERMTLSQAARHPYFEGVNVFEMFKKKPPELASGTVAANPEAGWTRRLMSVMLSPMPQDFTAAAANVGLRPVPETEVEAAGSFVSKMRLIPE